MFKKICHTVKCFGRRGCKCDEDTDHPVRPVSQPRAAAKRLQRQAMPKGMHRAKAPTKNKDAAAAKNLAALPAPAGGESGNDGEDADNGAVNEDTEMLDEDGDSQGDDQEMQEELDGSHEEGNESHDEDNESQEEGNESQEEDTESQAEEEEVEDEDHEIEERDSDVEEKDSDVEEKDSEAEEEDSEIEDQDQEAAEEDNADENDSATLVASVEEGDNGYDHSGGDDDVYPPPSPSIEAGDNSHDDNSDSEEINPPLSPSNKGGDSGSVDNSDEEQTYPPLPSSHGSSSSNTGSTTSEVSKHNPSEDSSSDDEFHSLPSAQVSRTSLVRKRKSDSDDDNSSSEDFYSLHSNYSHTGITPELSETGIGNRRRCSSRSSGVWTSGDSDRPRTTHSEYAYPSSQSGDSDEPHATHAEYAGSSSRSNDQSRGRRRWRTVDSQTLADLERGLYSSSGAATNSSGSKRARLDWPSPSETQAAQTRMHIYGPVASEIAAYRARGEQYLAWIDNPNEPECPIPPTTLTMNQLMTPNNEGQSWHRLANEPRQEPVQFGGGDPESMNIARGQGVEYRYTHFVLPPADDEQEGSSYIHYTARGIIVGDSIFRHNGPHWNDIASALYQDNYGLNTLRHIVFTDIANVETGPYIRYTLYPSILEIPWGQAVQYEAAIFEHGSPRYLELLGTALGRAAAALVLGGFPRGTMRISEIVTWNNSTSPQIRFQLEPVVDEPIAVPPAA